ncbi:MAG: hypothetical protein U0V48_02255 [Anaerolineales bacterium]
MMLQHLGFGFPRAGLFLPFIVIVFVHQWNRIRENIFKSPTSGTSHKNIFMDFRRVNLNVDLFGFRRVRFQRASHAVVEAHPKGKDSPEFWIAMFVCASPCIPIILNLIHAKRGTRQPNNVLALGV